MEIEERFELMLSRYMKNYRWYNHTPRKYYKFYGILMRSNDIKSIQLIDIDNKEWLMSIKEDNTVWYHSKIFLEAYNTLGINYEKFDSLLAKYIEKNLGIVTTPDLFCIGGDEFNNYVDDIIQQNQPVNFN